MFASEPCRPWGRPDGRPCVGASPDARMEDERRMVFHSKGEVAAPGGKGMVPPRRRLRELNVRVPLAAVTNDHASGGPNTRRSVLLRC